MSLPTSSAVGKCRMQTDVAKLIASKHEVTLLSGLHDFHIKFFGPHGTVYEGGVWKIRVCLHSNYPFYPPIISFVNKIYHPNIDDLTGVVCLDVINENWTALYDLSNVFEIFLPQLLTYPNPKDPFNSDAASLYLEDTDMYFRRVAYYVTQFASENSLRVAPLEEESSDSESSLSNEGIKLK